MAAQHGVATNIMTLLTTILLTIPTVTLAQSILQALPACAQPCLSNADFTGCSDLNVQCLCTSATYIQKLSCCMSQCDTPASGESSPISHQPSRHKLTYPLQDITIYIGSICPNYSGNLPNCQGIFVTGNATYLPPAAATGSFMFSQTLTFAETTSVSSTQTGSTSTVATASPAAASTGAGSFIGRESVGAEDFGLRTLMMGLAGLLIL